ncbi:MAG: DUF294 nucleotidyltransferase-like domain-containing protein [Aquabacterium sp.]
MDPTGLPIGTADTDLNAPLAGLPRKTLLTCGPDEPLGRALAAMHAAQVGSVVVADADGRPLGILTRHDLLGRVLLPRLSLDTPIAQVMSQPLQVLGPTHTLHDAALLMARQGLRHVPVVDDRGRLAHIVSEHDLHVLQRQTLAGLSERLAHAPDIAALEDGARGIRALARHLLSQGLGPRALATLISHLNDRLTQRVTELLAPAHGVDMTRGCWLAFGSEGRGEQTIATDQDNGLVFASDRPDADRPRWLAFARDVNEALDRLGYPLCKGNVMASNPALCSTAPEWAGRFTHWLEQGTPQDLLNASIYFDFRALAGHAGLLEPLHEAVRARRAPPRFLHLLAANALRSGVPLNWRGAVATQVVDGRDTLDLKLQGTALIVDAARVLAMAAGVAEVGTHERLVAAGVALGVPAHEHQAWAAAFEVLQGLRLRVQMGIGLAPATADQPNRIAPAGLNDLDREALRDALQVARRLQQRLALDWRA